MKTAKKTIVEEKTHAGKDFSAFHRMKSESNAELAMPCKLKDPPAPAASPQGDIDKYYASGLPDKINSLMAKHNIKTRAGLLPKTGAINGINHWCEKIKLGFCYRWTWGTHPRSWTLLRTRQFGSFLIA